MLRTATLLAMALALLAPGLVSAPAAFAQGPGDDQYIDPFGPIDPPDDDPTPPSDPEPAPPPGGGGGDGTTSSVPEETADTGDSTTGGTASTGTAGTEEELARTGLPAGLLASLGLTMLSLGVFLRLSLARGPRRWSQSSQRA